MKSFLKSCMPPIYYIVYCKNKQLYPKTRKVLSFIGALFMASLLSKITLTSLFILKAFKKYLEVLTFITVCKC